MNVIKNEDKWMFNIILVHVARTWERVRIEQPYQEMPQDNIESAEDAIPTITEEIFFNDVIQSFLNASDEVKSDGYWENNTKEGMSDSYIEELAERKIKEEYLS